MDVETPKLGVSTNLGVSTIGTICVMDGCGDAQFGRLYISLSNKKSLYGYRVI